MQFLVLAETLSDRFNRHPAAPFVFYAVLIVVGIVCIFRGLNAMKTKRFRGKYGKVTTGEWAVVTGKVFVGLGGLMTVIGAILLLYKGTVLLLPADGGSQARQQPPANRNVAQQSTNNSRNNAGNGNNANPFGVNSDGQDGNPAGSPRQGNPNRAGNGSRSTTPRTTVNQPSTSPSTSNSTPAGPPKTATLPATGDDSLPALRSMSQEKRVSSLAFSPDGKLLLSADGRRFQGGDKEPWSVYLWEVQTGQLQQKLDLQNAADQVRFSPDGGLVAVSDREGLLTLWEVPSGNLVKTIRMKARPGHRFGFRYDFDFLGGPERLILVGNEGAAVLDVATDEITKTWKNHVPITFSVDATPDGARAITGGSGDEFLVVGLPAGGIIDRFHTASKQVESLAISADGRRAITRSQRSNLAIWDLEKRQSLFAIPESPGMGQTVAISPDGRRVATTMSDPPAVHVWTAETGKLHVQFTRHSKGITTVAFSPDGRLAASGDYNGQIQVWEVPE